MTDEQLRRLHRVAAEADARGGSNIVYLPQVRRMAETIGRAAPYRDSRIEAIGNPPPEMILRCGLEAALDWHREHPGSDHLDAAFATAGSAGDLGHSRWPEFVTAVKEVTEAADAFRTAGLEAER